MPATIEALIVIALLVAPGYFCWSMMGAGIPRVFVSDAHVIVTALLLSVFIHVLVSPYTIMEIGNISLIWSAMRKSRFEQALEYRWVVFAWVFVILFVAPTIIALIISRLWRAKWTQPILERFGWSRVDMTPTAWDWFFLTQEQGCWVVAELNDGTRVGGQFGKDSFASMIPHGRDLFLESVYVVDENHDFGDRIPSTASIWINGESVNTVHFYRVESKP